MFNFKKGISLISLMVVIIVLGILAVVAIPNIKDIADNTRLSATLENKTNVQKAVDRYLLEKQEFPVETPGDLSIGSPQQVKWDLLSPDYLREKPADLDKIYYWVDYNGAVWVSNIDAPQNITINTVLGTTTITWDEVDGAKSYEVGYIDSSLAHQIQTRSLKALNASTSGYKVLGVVNSGDTLSFDTTDDLTGKTIVLTSVSENFKSVPVKFGYTGSELETVEGESVPSGPQPLQTEVPDGWIGVYTVEDLDNMRNNLSGKYILMNNIYLDIAPYNEGEGWEPIGSSSSIYFEGEFDGNGLTISNLYINKEANNIGLFGYVIYGNIENITLENANISGWGTIGTLAGTITATSVSNSHASGVVTGLRNSSSYGGLVGHNYKRYNTGSSIIANSSAQVDVTGWSYVGGLVGQNAMSYIYKSYATGNVMAEEIVGGLVGNSYGTQDISDSYATGNVVASNRIAGGLIGNLSSSAKVYRSYSTGEVQGPSFVGGFSGYKNPTSTSSQVFWDKEGSLLTFSPVGLGKTTSEMYQQSTYTGFDFDTIWSIDEGNDYPRLQWEN